MPFDNVYFLTNPIHKTKLEKLHFHELNIIFLMVSLPLTYLVINFCGNIVVKCVLQMPKTALGLYWKVAMEEPKDIS